MTNRFADIRLESLYRQKLVKSENSAKAFPLDFTLKREVFYFPEKPVDLNFDILEIGPGSGDFLFHLCKTHPEKRVLGIEIGTKRFEKLKENLTQKELTNLTLIFGDARAPLHNELSQTQFDKIFVLFPDPWPRNKHRHRRLLQVDFLKILSERLKTGGEFTLGTDVKDYADWALQNFASVPAMKNISADGGYSENLPDLIPTYFEKKWRERGRGVWYLRLVKE